MSPPRPTSPARPGPAVRPMHLAEIRRAVRALGRQCRLRREPSYGRRWNDRRNELLDQLDQLRARRPAEGGGR